MFLCFFFSSRRRHTRCALVTGVQTCALPISIIPGLIIRAGGQHFAIPRAAVVEILHDNNQTLRISGVGGARIATIRNLRHSMIDLEDVLGLEPMKEGGKRTIVVIRSTSGTPFALGVHAVDNPEDLVIRPASPLIMASGLYAGIDRKSVV